MAQDLYGDMPKIDEIGVWDIISPEEAVDVTVRVFGSEAAAEILGRVYETFLAGQQDDHRFWVEALAQLLAVGAEHRRRALH